MPKHLVTSALANRIYLTSINKNGTMSSKREDMTSEAIYAVFDHMKTNYERNGHTRLIIKGQGELKFIPIEDAKEGTANE